MSPVTKNGPNDASALGPKPLLRGWSHVVAAIGAVLFTGAVAVRCAGDPPRLISMLVYGLSMIAWYAGSAAYHIGTWSTSRLRVLRALDHSNIFLLIAGTTTPIAVNVLTGWERPLVLGLIWTLAGTGLALTVLIDRLSRRVRVGLYVGTGLANLVAAPTLFVTLPPTPVFLLGLGGALYTLGAVIYARRWPNPLPRILGHHEIFHLLVIAAGAAFATAIWFWVVPYARR